jgi:hypothetical protein
MAAAPMGDRKVGISYTARNGFYQSRTDDAPLGESFKARDVRLDDVWAVISSNAVSRPTSQT